MSAIPFQELLDDHAGAVWALLAGMVGADAADDCFQETFLAALRAWPQADHGADPRPWLLTIARRKALDHLRRTRRELAVAEVPELPAREPGAHERLASRAGFVGALAALPPGQRAAVGRRFLCDLSYRCIGRELGCTEQAARRRVADGLRTLRGRAVAA